MSENVKLKKELLISSAPLFFITSYYLMQSALNKDTSSFLTSYSSWVTIILSVLLLGFALNLVLCSIIARPESWVRTTYEISAFFGTVAALVFVIDLARALTDLISLKADPWYVYLFFAVGILLIFGVFINYFASILRTSSTKNSKPVVKDSE